MQRINAEVIRVLDQPEYQAALRKQNVEVPPKMSPAQFHELIENNLHIWKKIAKDANIQLES